MHWLFDGLGTFLVGLLLGAGGMRHIDQRRMTQKAGDGAQQIQAGGDVRGTSQRRD